MPEYYYRMDGYGFFPYLSKYKVSSHTPKGVWLELIDGAPEYGRKFVLNGSGKRFAYPDPKDARVSYIARKERQIQIVQKKLEAIRESLGHAKANRWYGPGQEETDELTEFRKRA